MKRLAVLLLALLLPVCALAESWGVTLEAELDETLFSEYVHEFADSLGGSAQGGSLDTVIQLLQRVLDGMRFEIIVQDDGAMTINFDLSGGRLLDMTTYVDENYTYLTSSMLPGYAVVSANTESADADTTAALSAIDSEVLANEIAGAVTAWLSGLEPVVSTGTFDGDAYEGGTRCTTWSVTDMDIAALLSSVMTGETREAAALILTSWGVDAEEALGNFDVMNANMADEDQHLYIFSIVEDDSEAIVGFTLKILRENAQIATVSLGVEDEELRLVVGLGLNKENYWFETSLQEAFTENSYIISGVSREWTGPKPQTFADVTSAGEPVAQHRWYVESVETANALKWDAALLLKTENGGEKYLFAASGEANDQVLDAVLSLGGGERAAMTLRLSVSEAAPIATIADDLEHCFMDDPEQEELYTTLMDKFSTALAVRMIKLLPMDLIMQLNMLP